MPEQENRLKVAYLAPEIPALSATFVYNEILALQKSGVEVAAFSVHRPVSPATEVAITTLASSVKYIYPVPLLTALVANFKHLFSRPKNYFAALAWLLRDIRTVGLLSRHARGLIYRFVYAAELAVDLIDKDITHLHVHFAHVPTDIGMYAARIAGVSFSLTAHANDIFERGWLLKEKADRSAFFGTISEFNRQYLLGLGLPEDKLKIIRCGVSRDWRQDPQPRTDEIFTIGVVARFVEKKGLDILLKAAAELKKQRRKFRLDIVGNGPLAASFNQMAIDMQLDAEHVRFRGVMAHDEVAGFLAGLDAFVLPCRKDKNGDMDGIPVVLMEAMLAGVSVVSTNISGIPELIIDGQTGLLPEAEDVEGIVHAVDLLMTEPALVEQMKQNAVRHVCEEFSLETNADRLRKLYLGSIDRTSL
ncbi:MAG: glycosyltransferase family 4 protein [Methylophaga sp.]|nr:glycosyltransferase family 4 protein [Methylophaga sp.]